MIKKKKLTVSQDCSFCDSTEKYQSFLTTNIERSLISPFYSLFGFLNHRYMNVQLEADIECIGVEISEEDLNAAASPAQREMKATLGFVVSPSDVTDSSVIQTILSVWDT